MLALSPALHHLAHLNVGQEAAEALPLALASGDLPNLEVLIVVDRYYDARGGSLIPLMRALKGCSLVCLKILETPGIGDKGGQELARALRQGKSCDVMGLVRWKGRSRPAVHHDCRV